jgi:hypothetical protein
VNRLSIWAVLGISLVVGGGIIITVLSHELHIDRATFNRIEVGLRKAEVDAILGGPSGDYTTKAECRWFALSKSEQNGGLVWEPGHSDNQVRSGGHGNLEEVSRSRCVGGILPRTFAVERPSPVKVAWQRLSTSPDPALNLALSLGCHYSVTTWTIPPRRPMMPFSPKKPGDRNSFQSPGRALH